MLLVRRARCHRRRQEEVNALARDPDVHVGSARGTLRIRVSAAFAQRLALRPDPFFYLHVGLKYSVSMQPIAQFELTKPGESAPEWFDPAVDVIVKRKEQTAYVRLGPPPRGLFAPDLKQRERARQRSTRALHGHLGPRPCERKKIQTWTCSFCCKTIGARVHQHRGRLLGASRGRFRRPFIGTPVASINLDLAWVRYHAPVAGDPLNFFAQAIVSEPKVVIINHAR